jgi:hypothetical protein
MEEAPGALGVTGAAGAMGGGEGVAAGAVGGAKVVGARFSAESLAAGNCEGGVSEVVVVCATASDVSDRQAVKVERI